MGKTSQESTKDDGAKLNKAVYYDIKMVSALLFFVMEIPVIGGFLSQKAINATSAVLFNVRLKSAE